MNTYSRSYRLRPVASFPVGNVFMRHRMPAPCCLLPPPRCMARRAMTLFELIAVTFIIGIVSLMATTRYSLTTLADIGATGFARRVALDCGQARRRAIASGTNHLLRFTLVGGNATQY